MNFAESFRERIFVVADPDARIRRDEDLMESQRVAGGGFKTIPDGSEVEIVEVKLFEAGSRSTIIFGRATSVDGTQVFGWTSTRNLKGNFVNETIGAVLPEPGASRFGPNAAWSRGEYVGQLELAAIVDATLDIERIALRTAGPFASLVRSSCRFVVTEVRSSACRCGVISR